jgi:predicted CoA-substrate-specific enzyme activase
LTKLPGLSDIAAATQIDGTSRWPTPDADLIVNEITAQAGAALSYDSLADTVVEIGGQDSKWISLEEGHVQDFEMNRVCAAGTGSFLMAQAQRLDLPMGDCFSDAAFSSQRPADLGNRCTVFMESDLIHHQNSGASSADLAAGVCISIVHNYLERVANHKPLGRRVLFMGGVAATPAVKAAFEQQTLRKFETPAFFRVSGAVGAALKALGKLERKEIVPKERPAIKWDPEEISKEQLRAAHQPVQGQQI